MTFGFLIEPGPAEIFTQPVPLQKLSCLSAGISQSPEKTLFRKSFEYLETIRK